MKNTSGFTILELLTVVAIFAVLATIAIPGIITWKNNAQYRGTVNTLSSDLAAAKQTAIRLNSQVAIRFNGNQYTIFVDDGAGTDDEDGDGIADGFGNGSIDGSERLVQQREIPTGVSISEITFPDNFTTFNGRGRCPAANVGRIVFTDPGNGTSTISINRLGRVNIG